MRMYLDADIFLGLLKENDRHKTAAQKFLQTHKEEQLVTSVITLLEIWFYLYKNGCGDKTLDSIRAVRAIAEILPCSLEEIEAAAILAEHHSLSPADAVHAILSLNTASIVSSDASFDRITGLQRIDFSET